MVFKIYKAIKEKLRNFKYYPTDLFSYFLIKIVKKKIKREEKKITKKIIDFIKYK